jgi:hypothetical protein
VHTARDLREVRFLQISVSCTFHDNVLSVTVIVVSVAVANLFVQRIILYSVQKIPDGPGRLAKTWKTEKLAVKFCEGPIAVFRICKRCGEGESRRGEQQEQCQPREHLFIGGKGSTRLCCAYFPNTRWPSGDCFARRSLFLRRKQASARGRATLHHETITHKRT